VLQCNYVYLYITTKILTTGNELAAYKDHEQFIAFNMAVKTVVHTMTYNC